MQGKGRDGGQVEKERKETSANYNVQQAKLLCRLRLSLAPLKNDGGPALYSLVVKNSPCQEGDIIY